MTVVTEQEICVCRLTEIRRYIWETCCLNSSCLPKRRHVAVHEESAERPACPGEAQEIPRVKQAEYLKFYIQCVYV